MGEAWKMNSANSKPRITPSITRTVVLETRRSNAVVQHRALHWVPSLSFASFTDNWTEDRHSLVQIDYDVESLDLGLATSNANKPTGIKRILSRSLKKKIPIAKSGIYMITYQWNSRYFFNDKEKLLLTIFTHSRRRESNSRKINVRYIIWHIVYPNFDLLIWYQCIYYIFDIY